MRNNTIVQKKYQLECLSPVHIGNGEKLKAYEYLYDKKEGIVYFLDEAKWIAFLSKHKLIDAFTKYLCTLAEQNAGKNYQQRQNVWDWLLKQGVSPVKIRILGERKAQVTTEVMTNPKTSLNDIACQISLAGGQPYIPGSSIKGALRTGILFYLLQQNQSLCNRYWKRIYFVYQNYRKNAYFLKKEYNKIIRDLEQELLDCLKNPHANAQRVSSQVRSVMRGLVVSDAMCIQQQNTVILQKIDVSADKDTEKRLPLYRECLPSGTRLHLLVTLDTAMMAEIGIHSVEEIIAMSRDYIQQGLAWQKKVFYTDYEKEFALANEADLILGGGTGFLTKNLFYALAPTMEDGRQVVRNLLDKLFYKHKHEQLDKRISPRTLKLTQSQQGESIMGLCCLQEIKTC